MESLMTTTTSTGPIGRSRTKCMPLMPLMPLFPQKIIQRITATPEYLKHFGCALLSWISFLFHRLL